MSRTRIFHPGLSYGYLCVAFYSKKVTYRPHNPMLSHNGVGGVEEKDNDVWWLEMRLKQCIDLDNGSTGCCMLVVMMVAGAVDDDEGEVIVMIVSVDSTLIE